MGSPLGLFVGALESVEAGVPVDGLRVRAQLTHIGDQLRAGARVAAERAPVGDGFARMVTLTELLEAAVVHVERGDVEAARAALWEALRASFGREGGRS